MIYTGTLGESLNVDNGVSLYISIDGGITWTEVCTDIAWAMHYMYIIICKYNYCCCMLNNRHFHQNKDTFWMKFTLAKIFFDYNKFFIDKFFLQN